MTLDIATRMVGRWVSGTAAAKAGDQSWKSPCLGRWRSRFWPIPFEMPKATWKWQHDPAADQELLAEAAKEARESVLEGIPGERDFWTWRRPTL